MTAHDIEGHTLTESAAKLLADYHSGPMPQPQRQAFDAVVEAMRGSDEARTAAAKQGYGMTPGRTLDVANRGVQPITPERGQLERRRVRVGQAGGREIARLERGVRRSKAVCPTRERTLVARGERRWLAPLVGPVISPIAAVLRGGRGPRSSWLTRPGRLSGGLSRLSRRTPTRRVRRAAVFAEDGQVGQA